MSLKENLKNCFLVLERMEIIAYLAQASLPITACAASILTAFGITFLITIVIHSMIIVVVVIAIVFFIIVIIFYYFYSL